ncbi:MAG TPA: hypothetical protein VEP90_05485, partial [Methylomirabilota bacterium]|nr:hypothetical protein [Methylomirabilota bacterium]
MSLVPTTYTTYIFKFNINVPANKPFAVGFWDTCTFCDVSNYVTVGVSATAPTGQNAASFESISGWDCATPAGCPTTNDFQFTMLYANLCPAGYTCQNAFNDVNNLLNLKANSTFPGIAISNSPIDFASAASKELFWFETWTNSTNIVSQPIAWFLTTNQTLATQTNYNPLNDSSVILINIMYPNPTNGIKNYYNYQAKTAGQSLISTSGTETNPYPTCPQSATLYICSQSTAAFGTAFHDFSMTMNYTGTASAGGPNGASLTCSDTTPGVGPNTYDFCLSAYAPSPCASANAPACSTRVFPYLNVNQGPYYIGYWSAAGQTGNIQFGTSNSGAFSRRANMAFVWVPNPCGGTAVNCAQSTTDTGGFFGWLGHTVGTAFSIAGNTLGNAFSPLLNVGGSIMGAFISALVQGLSILIQGFIAVFNVIGNLLGLGNIGTDLAQVMSGIGSTLITTFKSIVQFFALAISLIQSSFFTFIINTITIWNGIVTILIAFWNLMVDGSWNVSVLLFLYYGYGLLTVYKRGMRGFWGWLLFTRFLVTFIFEFSWYIFNLAVRGFISI